ncbi:tripartite tricarboxylate transporter TctB family protein [Halomonas sp. V046]|uniref:tripartite tricarboxylate transporter TctB family protein n=1 Tax=Halomonas sp. V046 TaxID=3459611 RepID=UPI004043B8E7
MTLITKDRALAVAMLILCGIFYAESGNIRPPTTWQTYGSAMFPRLLLGVIAVLSILILIRSVLEKRAETQKLTWLAAYQWIKNNHKVLLLFTLFGIYAAVLPLAGYLVSTIVFLACAIGLLLGLDSRRKSLLTITVSLTAGLAIYVVFQFGLNIWLP